MSREIEAVVFDLDGILVQSEELWDAARRELADQHGIEWPDGAKYEEKIVIQAGKPFYIQGRKP